ncbi:MAG TPA: Ig-like domain-containing protein, partial [Actinomycetaceae bacterium]|nr:Ig-like domain-containing protein [Actinomycetaceae bacterium]
MDATRSRRTDPRRRQRVVSAATVGVLGAGLVVAGVLYDGVATADVDLHDGGVWVTSQEHMRLGRLNSQVQLLDGSLTARSTSFDVLQDAGDVFLVDEGAGLLQQVDPATVTTTTAVSLPGPRRIELGGDTVAVLDTRSGQVHTAPAGGVGRLADDELPAATRLGAEAAIAVGVDGTTYGVSPSDATLVTVPAGFDPEGEEEPHVADLGVGPERLADAEIQVSAVGEEPVVLVRDEQDRVTLLRPGTDPVDLTGLADTAQVELQAPSAAAREVVVAARDGMLRVPLGRGEPTLDPVSQPGTPSEPVVVAGCSHGAWASGTGVHQARCGNGETVEQPIDKSLTDARLVFRVNRDVVVLNDLVSGTVWLVKDAMEIVENWDDVIPPQDASDDEEESQQEVQEQLPLDREQENRPPVAQDDDLGVRAGSTTVLEVLANDSDPDGDLLTVTAFETPPEAFGTV